MKKVIKLLSVILVLSSLFVAAAFAADEAEFAVTPSAEEVKVGEEFTVDVELVTNPGIEGIEFEVAYDANHFELVDSSIAISGTSDFDGEFFCWFNISGSDYTGSVLELTFKVLDYKAYEDSTITIQKLLAGTVDNQVDMDDVVATITVTHEHDWADWWDYDTKTGKHWKACTVEGCEAKNEEASCSFAAYTPNANKDGLCLEATCVDPALYYKECSVCGATAYELYEAADEDHKDQYLFSYGEPLPHTFTCENADEKYLASAADCDSAAEYYKSCEDCGLSSEGTDQEDTFTWGDALGHDWADAWTESEDGKGHYHVCENGCGDTTTTYAAHTGGTATCVAKAVCSVCNQEYGELAKHVLSGDTYEHENGQHWKACTVEGCDYATEKTDCAGTGTPTCTERVSCATCGNPFGAYGKHTLVWVSQDGNHWQKCTYGNCDYETKSESCSGGIATCIAKAVCSTCEKEYGQVDPDGHKWKQGVSDGEGNHSAKCELCNETEDSVPCAGTGANAPTCTEKGKCDVCGYVIPELGHDYDTTKWVETGDGKGHYHACSRCDDTTKDYAAHTGGTATCQALAKCETCSFEYGELAACDFTKKDTEAEGALAQAATCVAPAEYYYSCSVCGKVNNAEGAETFTYGDPDTVNGHKADTAWTADDENDQHYHKCLNEGCTAMLDAADCAGTGANAPTCTEKGKCDVCGQEYGEIDPNNHDLEFKDLVDPTCTAGGTAAHWECKDCHKLFKMTEGDDMVGEETDLLGLTIAPTPDDYDAHKWVWGKNETGHWKYCDYCYELDEDGVGPGDENHPNTTPAPHVFGDWVTANGYKTKTCECGYYISEKVETGDSGTGSNVPATGDDTPIALWALVFLCSGAAAVALGLKKKEN